MPEELFPSSYRCDCGHESHFVANTILGIKTGSHKKGRRKVYLGDSERTEHFIVFQYGEMVGIICPRKKMFKSHLLFKKLSMIPGKIIH